MVDVGVLIGKSLMWIFVLFLAGMVGYLGYIFFMRLKQYIGIKPKEKTKESKSSEKQTPKDKQSRGKFCGNCGSSLNKEDSFCSSCGSEV